MKPCGNFDPYTIASFGDEWSRHRQHDIDETELQKFFNAYFHIVPCSEFSQETRAFDMGTGTGRWARFVAPKVAELHVIDASSEALAVARMNLMSFNNVHFHHATTDCVDLEPESFDFGYSLGVLHHIPDTAAALRDCTRLLKPNGRMLIYLYYRFDNRAIWFQLLWRLSDILRKLVYPLPPIFKNIVTDIIATFIYWPLSRLARLVEHIGFNSDSFPLSNYRHSSMATLRTDSRDRFGTPLEQRFTRGEITRMMEYAGLKEIHFSDQAPFWCATGTKRKNTKGL